MSFSVGEAGPDLKPTKVRGTVISEKPNDFKDGEWTFSLYWNMEFANH